MQTYVVHSLAGEILRRVTCPAAMIALQLLGDEQALSIPRDQITSGWRVHDGALVPALDYVPPLPFHPDEIPQ